MQTYGLKFLEGLHIPISKEIVGEVEHVKAHRTEKDKRVCHRWQ